MWQWATELPARTEGGRDGDLCWRLREEDDKSSRTQCERERRSRGVERDKPLKSEEGGAGGEVSRNNNTTDKNTQGTRLVITVV